MKGIRSIAAACAVVFAAAVAARADGPAPKATGPRIAVDPPSFDFGKALPQRSLTREFNIRNFGDADLLIERVTTTCGCTVAPLDPARKMVKAGGSVPLRVTLTTTANPGPMAKSVLVRSNDPARPSLEIKLQATVVAETP